MTMMLQEVLFKDENDEEGTSSWYYDGTLAADPVDAGMIALLEAVSDAEVAAGALTAFDGQLEGTATEGVYDDAEDKLTLEFLEVGSGNRVIRQFPSPNEGIFLPDSETVDEDQITDLIDWCETNDRGPTGQALDYIKGYRSRTRKFRS